MTGVSASAECAAQLSGSGFRACGARKPDPPAGRPVVNVVQATKHRSSNHASPLRGWHEYSRSSRRFEVERSMRTSVVVVRHVLAQHSSQVVGPQNAIRAAVIESCGPTGRNQSRARHRPSNWRVRRATLPHEQHLLQRVAAVRVAPDGDRQHRPRQLTPDSKAGGVIPAR